MAKPQVTHVTYTIDAQSSGGRFSVSKKALTTLGILDPATDKLVTPAEIYGRDVKEIRPNQHLRVTVSKIE
jgi:hypothetical protein